MSAKHSRLTAASTSTAALASAPRTLSANLSLHLNVERLAEQWIYSPIGIHGCSRALWPGATRQSISENTEEVLHVSIMLPDIHPASLQSCYHRDYLSWRLKFTAEEHIVLMLMLL